MGVCPPVVQILTLFQVKQYYFLYPFSTDPFADLASRQKLYESLLKPGFHMIVRIVPIVPVVSQNFKTIGTTETIAGFHTIVSIASKTQQCSWVQQQNLGATFGNKIADVNRRASLLACYLLILSILRCRRARRIPQRYGFWVRQIYQK